MTRKIAVLVSLLMFVCETFGLAAEAKSLRHHGPRISIAWPYGCAFYPIDDAAKNKHKLERDCAAALASVTGWPNAPERCDYDYGERLFLGSVPDPRFLPLRPGKFLVEFDCGAGGYNPFKVYGSL